jgi:hypothetical protein
MCFVTLIDLEHFMQQTSLIQVQIPAGLHPKTVSSFASHHHIGGGWSHLAHHVQKIVRKAITITLIDFFIP